MPTSFSGSAGPFGSFVGGGPVGAGVVGRGAGGLDVGAVVGTPAVGGVGSSLLEASGSCVVPTWVAATPRPWSGVHAAVAGRTATAAVRASTRRRWPPVRNGELARCIVTPCLNASRLSGALH